MLVVDARAWCMSPYREGGCAGFWARRRWGWERQAWHAPLLVYSRPSAGENPGAKST